MIDRFGKRLSDANNSSIVRGFVEEVLNDGKIDAAGKYFGEDMVEQVPLPGQGPGACGVEGRSPRDAGGVSRHDWSIEEQLSDGDRVMTRFEWTGTHRGEFLGVPATGRPVKVWGMVIDRLVDEKIKDTRILMDTLGLMMQSAPFPRQRKTKGDGKLTVTGTVR